MPGSGLRSAIAGCLAVVSCLLATAARQGNFIAPAGAPRVPAGLSGTVDGVVGLDTRPIFGAPQSEEASARFAREAPAAAPSATRDNVVSGYVKRTGTASGCRAATG